MRANEKHRVCRLDREVNKSSEPLLAVQSELNSRTCKVTFIAFLLWLSTIFSDAYGNNKESAAVSCKEFVLQFYNWYDVIADKPGSEPTVNSALKNKQMYFSPYLYRLLQEDTEAQSKVADEIVGIDFDPFLNTNSSPYDKYVAGNVLQKGDHFWVQMYGVNSGRRSDKPVVVPELARLADKWQFVNFHYGKTDFPVNENLLSILNMLRKNRQNEAN